MRTDLLGRRVNENSKNHLLKHGGVKFHKPTYQCWQDMKQRCYNENHKQYPNYGARGIVVCERWLNSFENFLTDMGDKPDAMTIDRIDNDGNYSPDNCRWATNHEQQRNKRTTHKIEHNGMCKTLREWAKYLGVHEATLSYRLNKGYPTHLLLSRENLNIGNVSPIKAMAKVE